jgi:hypothetical protein
MVTKILTAVWTAVLIYTSVPSPVISLGTTPDQRDSWYLETPAPTPTEEVSIWANAPVLTGFGTTYDAFDFAGSWYDSPKTWVQEDPAGNRLTPSLCAKHPEYNCYQRDMGGWLKLVRPWSTTLNDMYAALGPLLRKRIGDQMPGWHGVPQHKVLVTSLQTGISVEVWIADYCDCRQRHPNGPASAWSLIDLSPQVWEALGRKGKPGGKIEVRYLP